MKKISVLGSGNVGEILANGFLKHGYSVMRGSRDVQKLEAWKQKSGPNAFTGTFVDASNYGDIVVLAVKGMAAEDVVSQCAAALKGKIVLDATNPIADKPPQDGMVSFFTNLNESLMEKLQSKADQAKFVKCFSSVGAHLMVNPALPTKPSMFICGNDAEAKAETQKVLNLFGWETEDMGGAASARVIEPLCILWCIPGFLRNDWIHAFKMVRP